METIKKLLLILTISGVSLSALAETTSETESFNALKSQTKKIDAMKRLPIAGFTMVKSGDRTMLISDNGRFVITQPEIVDMWNMKKITTIEQTQDLDRIDLKKIGIKDEDLSMYTVGDTSSTKEVTLFVDPRCPHCSAMLNQISALKSKYKFKLVVLPLLGKESSEIVRRMECSNNNNLVVDSLLSKQYSNLPQKTDCGTERLQKSVTVAALLGINGVPFIIAPNGKAVGGRIDDLAAFLTKNEVK